MKLSTFSIEQVYRTTLTSMLSFREKIKIVVIGANDGKIGDPTFLFAQRYPSRTSMLLIEPQATLIPYLRETYSFHPDCIFFNGAIGFEDEVSFYTIRQEFWESVQPHYAINWPIYRAPTGVASTLKEHVENWVSNVCDLDQEDIIERVRVKCTTLAKLLRDHDDPGRVDVLQIDTEGTDDEVLTACEIEKSKPRLIIMETIHLGKEREAELAAKMRSIGYTAILSDMNSLFIRDEVDQSSSQ